MAYGCADTIDDYIINGLVWVPHNEIKSTLVGFYHNISKVYTKNGSSETFIDLPYDVVITIMNNTLLIHRGDN